MLAASYFFYGFWKIEFAALMLFTSLLDWFSARKLHQSSVKSVRLFWMWFAISIDLSLLFLFKYFDFALGKSWLAESMYDHSSTAWIIELGKYTIPAGISFYTFQSISYVVDVYRGDEIPENNPIKFMLFVSFFRSWWLVLLSDSGNYILNYLPDTPRNWKILKTGQIVTLRFILKSGGCR